ncbi:MAG: NADH-quinone oxidoreductase subunit A [Dinoroseobacter sp.]
MDDLLREYLPILAFLAVAIGFGLIFLLAAALLAVRNPDPEKVSAYECGFNAFDDARMKFDVRFYLVSILFIIFDLEIAFLFPWAVAFKDLSDVAFWSMIVFLGVLTIGFAYEWKRERSNGSDDRSQHRRRRQRSRHPSVERGFAGQGVHCDLDLRPDQLGAHRLTSLDDLWVGLLRR